MAPAMATSRLRKELTNLHKDPPPGVIAEPLEKDILIWHYAVRGPEDTAYEGGIYIGKLKFPTSYPMNAPSIYMLTPSGRFQINKQICMSMSNFHPESWNPLWSVATIIQGVQSFMASEEMTTGGLKAPSYERKRLAEASLAYNKKTYGTLFDGDIEAAFDRAEEARAVAEKNKASSSSAPGNKATPKTPNSSSTRSTTPSTTESTSSRTAARGGRRRRAAAAARTESNNSTEVEEEDGIKEEKNESLPELAVNELTPEEIEKRKKRNAKKRAKQKAKKAAAAGKQEGDFSAPK